jgi:hypothetical protein
MVPFGLTQPILAQVNTVLGFSSILGIGLAGSGIALYALRSMRPKLARDQDIFFAAVALLCGGILFFQGWRQDPILQFGQFLLTGTAIFFAVESIRLRGAATEQAKRNSPIVDDDRPVSRVYRAELDEINAYDDRAATRRIRGTRDARAGREEYNENARPRRAGRSPEERSSMGERRRGQIEDVGYGGDRRSDSFEDRPTRSPSAARPDSRDSRPRRPRSEAEDSGYPRRERPSRIEEPSASEYVDYRPVNAEDDNW